MKSARFLAVALLCAWNIVGFAATAFTQHSDRTFCISGYVLDSLSRRPIAGVLVRLADAKGCNTNCEALTDSQGHFVLQSSRHFPTASYAVVKTVYFEGRTLVALGKKAETMVLLHRNRFRFAAAGYWPPADSARVSPYASEHVFGDGYTKGFQSFYIANPDKRAAGFLQTITFDEAKMRPTCGDLRLRVFSVDALTGQPRGNILNETLPLCLFQEPLRPRLVTYDISRFEIPVPADGFYISLEEMSYSGKFYPCLPVLLNYAPRGLVLRTPCTYEQCRTWTWKNMLNIEGIWTPPAENCWPLYESALSVEVEPTSILPKSR